jgi:hypothetical protein
MGTEHERRPAEAADVSIAVGNTTPAVTDQLRQAKSYDPAVPAYLRSELVSEVGPELSCAPEYPLSLQGPVCEPVPENPLAGYEFLLFALDLSQLQDLQDAAYRREHLRRGLNFSGPHGLMFAQAPLHQFLEPGSEYLSREELLSAFFPAMRAAGRQHGDVEPYVGEIARNEAARNFIEPLRNPLVNVELVDPEGKQDTPSSLKFVANFNEITDVHGAIPLANLIELSRASFALVEAKAAVNARQLSEIALLQAQLDWMNGDYLSTLLEMTAGAKRFAYLQVESAVGYAFKVNEKVAELDTYLWPENRDQAPAVAKLKEGASALEAAANNAIAAAKLLRQETDPGRLTMGEHWEQNAQNIRKARSEAWEEGGLWGTLKGAGNTIGLGANKLVRTFGNVATGGYMQTNADRTSAYRRGEISYNSYSGFSFTDVLKGAVQDIAILLPGYGGKLGEAAIGFFGVEGQTAAAYVLEGQAVGLASGVTGAAANDFSSLIAAELATSSDESMFQRSLIGGWETWLESGTEGFAFGSLMGAGTAMFPRPTALQSEGPRPAIEPAKTVESGEGALTSPLEEPALVSTMEPDLPSGRMMRLKRAALYKLTRAALEGSTPLNELVGDFGQASQRLPEPARTVAVDAALGGRELLSVIEAPAPLAQLQPAAVQLTAITPEIHPTPQVMPAAQPAFELASQGVRPAAGMRVTTRAERKEQEGSRRWTLAVDQLVDSLDLSPAAGTAAAPTEAQTATEINIQSAIRRAIQEIRDSGIRPAGNAAYGTRLHAALARILRVDQLPADVTIQVEQALSTFANLPPRVLSMIVRDWLRTDGGAYGWLEAVLPSRLLDTVVGNLRIDARLTVGDHSVVFDLTSRELEEHLAKTMLYAALLAQEGKISRVQEYYWVRWRWRGQ